MSGSQTTPSVWVVDLSEVRFRYGTAKRSVAAVGADGQVYAVARAGGTDRASAEAVLEAASASYLLRENASGELISHRLGWYNPFTATVTVPAHHDGQYQVYSSGAALVLDPGGSGGHIGNDAALHVGTATLDPVALSLATVRRQLTAHQQR